VCVVWTRDDTFGFRWISAAISSLASRLLVVVVAAC